MKSIQSILSILFVVLVIAVCVQSMQIHQNEKEKDRKEVCEACRSTYEIAKKWYRKGFSENDAAKLVREICPLMQGATNECYQMADQINRFDDCIKRNTDAEPCCRDMGWCHA
ncbi:hypothetical protein PPL_06810 [Heterostelium album PN500]|uniref:Saposin B-type domain-containing protein n=1 Tax=Heterostelium pallidum (strain ATCC 26659 / Pp 5 / PN500) TaxID=670386 RepID=D3BDK8_HETP5|nr:hypothetical protein PPL_06810 [Heterostelium album PN500]EFA79989.1 hypothetical protein PPL_06810 [Heterostelium album PN500]|eukprot:XP_020432109.1 hypothetical protein PPL_06810 [Heterostelium album PN500]